ncbi:MAG TPA: serine/threonine-protein kinase PknH/PknJ [Mycobacterium sp.]|nr:serine/threonine-protein kinase PknH/PknJ [Mycobacterium sp.]HTQ15780.1 serine/threonine-protein kinase PknH/PknJ [Mycobacterium sp.]
MSDTPRDSRVGTQFGPYLLKRLLGRGGMGEVYEAEHTVKNWTVALKLMSADISENPDFRERMQREARITGQLTEPHVVPIHEYGEIDGQLYLEMRLIRGTDLQTLLRSSGPMEPARAVALVRQIASALDAAHAAGVIHRDVKPHNVLVTDDDFAYLVDFGIAKGRQDAAVTKPGAAVGSWQYMAPERFGKSPITKSADIYALACVLHECLTGSPPFHVDTLSELVSAHLMEPVPRPTDSRPDVPADFDAIIARGMAKVVGERYQTAGDLARDAQEALSATGQLLASRIVDDGLQRTVQDTPTVADTVTELLPQRKSSKRRLPLAAAVLTSLVAAAVAAVFLWPRPTPAPSLPTVQPDRLDSILLGTDEINAVMGASNMQSGQAIQTMDNPGTTVSDQECLGALYANQRTFYEGSGFTGLRSRILYEPGDTFDHWLIETAVSFPSGNSSHVFVRNSADKWKFCPGRTVTVTKAKDKPVRWTFGKLSGAPPKIALLKTQLDARGWGCQHVLSAVSNVVLDVEACSYHIADEAGQIADKMAAQMPR